MKKKDLKNFPNLTLIHLKEEIKDIFNNCDSKGTINKFIKRNENKKLREFLEEKII